MCRIVIETETGVKEMARTHNKTKGGAVVTTAPTDDVPPITGRDFGSARQSYGANQYAGPSSVNPGKSISSGLADELRTKQTGLEEVIATGSRHSDDPAVFTG